MGSEKGIRDRYQDWTLSTLRKRLEKEYKVAYERQVIKLVTPYHEAFLTDDLVNDTMTLPKLKFVNEAQVILKTLESNNNKGEGKESGNGKERGENEDEEDNDLICFIVERDDEIGIKRLYFDKHSTLVELLTHVMKVEGMKAD